MKTFVYKVILFSTFVFAIVTFILISFGGYVDYFYNKFTTPKAKSMILGDSRSFQGIQPRIINDFFNKESYSLPILNYSFTIAQISYDSHYLASIKRKLDTTATKGLFIVSVHPWVLSKKFKDSSYAELQTSINIPPHNMRIVNKNPNYEYLLRNFSYFHFKSIFRRKSYVHKDGWLEESNLPKDTLLFNKWKKNQIQMYKDFSKKWHPSQLHIIYLEKTIEYLRKYGKVVLVRMPIDAKLLLVEQKYWPNFEKEMKLLSRKKSMLYISFIADSLKYKTYDGNHIDKYAGKIFTQDLCTIIDKDIND